MKIIILDRDGVINEDNVFVNQISEFKWIEGIFDLLRHFQKYKYQIYIATNQSGIGRGHYTEAQYFKLTEYMLSEFQKKGIFIEDTFYCPHHPDENCNCRKPKTGMVDELFEENKIDLEKSFVIGDKDSDIKFGQNLGLRTIRVLSSYPKNVNADFEVMEISEIKDIIPLAEESENERNNY